MSSASRETSSTVRDIGDRFALGVLVMLLVNVVQRGVGLVRGVGLASFLSDRELGQWALANSFLIVAVPIAVLGLPGSFGKFVEHFRVRSSLRAYVWRTMQGTLLGTLFLAMLILVFPDAFNWIVFGSNQTFDIVVWCVICLVSTIALSFATELLAGLREVQTVSYMQFVQSLSFAILGIGLVAGFGSWWLLLPAFSLANVLALLPGMCKLLAVHAREFESLPDATLDAPKATTQIWRRILPFAASLWMMNLLNNLFVVGDRYMLLHWFPGGPDAAQAVVGQYHCARIMPNLLMSVGFMLGGILLPYLSSDWERGKIELVHSRIRQLLQAVAIAFLAMGTAAMLVAPLLFGTLLGGRYQLAAAVIPLALAQATWAAFHAVAEPYMLVAERGKQLVVMLTLSLTVNLVLNWFLIERYGLAGAIVATALANILALGLLLWRMHRYGCHLRPATAGLCCSPLALLGGPIVSASVLVLVVFLAGRTNWILDDEDREQLDQMVRARAAAWGWRFESLWP